MNIGDLIKSKSAFPEYGLIIDARLRSHADLPKTVSRFLTIQWVDGPTTPCWDIDVEVISEHR